jgi:CubicO group peptidase (beta-lactamase class C family)
MAPLPWRGSGRVFLINSRRKPSTPRQPLLSLSIAVWLLALVTVPSNGVAQSATSVPACVDLRGIATLPLTNTRRAEFEAYVASAMNRFRVPGASVAVVQDGAVVDLLGFGVKKVDGTAPVTPDTLFAIASTNKALTSAMAATVVDDGFMSWDTPVLEMLPGFAVPDAALTPRLTVADTFCMCTGIPARTMQIVFSLNSLTPRRLIASVADMPLTAPFGERFQYSNQMYAIGGYAATVAAGGAPDDLNHGYHLAMRNRILGPIGMTRSTFTLDQVLAGGDYAYPHFGDLEGRVRPLSLLATARLAEIGGGPAGAMWSDRA